MMNAMLINYGLPHNMRGETILSANCLLNKVPTKKHRRLHMSYGNDDNHSINICKCGDMWPKW